MTDDQRRRDGSDLEAAWQRGEAVEITTVRPRTSVLSIRVPAELLEQLSERARERGIPASLLARQIIEKTIATEGPVTPAALSAMFSHWVEEASSAPRVTVAFTSSHLANVSWIESFASLAETFAPVQRVLSTRVFSSVIQSAGTSSTSERVA